MPLNLTYGALKSFIFLCQVAQASSPWCARWTPSTTRLLRGRRWRSGGRVSWPWRATRATTTSPTSREPDASCHCLRIVGVVLQTAFFLPFFKKIKSRFKSIQTVRSAPAFWNRRDVSSAVFVSHDAEADCGRKVSKQTRKLLPCVFDCSPVLCRLCRSSCNILCPSCQLCFFFSPLFSLLSVLVEEILV